MKVSFTEELRGYYSVGSPAYDAGDKHGQWDFRHLSFRVEISADDFAAVLADPRHRMSATGTVSCKEFGPAPCTINDGTFDLFVAQQNGTRRYLMRYRLPFTTKNGKPMTLLGFKDVGNDWGWDAWRDTTTLFTRLVCGTSNDLPDNPNGDTYARGILRITAPRFARQLSTFRGTPAGVLRYFLFFLTTFFKAYPFPPRPPRKRPR